MEKEQQNQEKTASAPQEEAKAISMADIWIKTTKSYWDAMMWKKPEENTPEPSFIPKVFRNGTATRTRNAWNTSVSMWKSLSLAMIDPKMTESYFKAAEEMPEMMLKMQRKELDRFFKWNSDMMGKTEGIEKLMNLMCLRSMK